MTDQDSPDGGAERDLGDAHAGVPGTVGDSTGGTAADTVAGTGPVAERPVRGGLHRRTRGLLDRWYLILGAALVLALIPVAATVLGGSPRNDAIAPPQLPTVAGSTTADARAATDSPSAPGTAAPSATHSTPAGGGGAGASPGSPGPPTPTPALATASPTSTLPASLTVTATHVFRRGDSVRTARTVLSMGSDGDLAVTDQSGARLWHSNTGGGGWQAVFQDDGNFVVYAQAGDGQSLGRPMWVSNTPGRPGAVLVLQANGDVCVVDKGTAVWCAGTAH